MAQEHMQRNSHEHADSEIDEVSKESVKTEGIDEDVDRILDEIDEVLETNAEDFVKSFIQKGGQ